MLAFLAAGAHSDAPLSPSPLVDDFWHAFLLHTKAYQKFCADTLGKFVHHQPGFLDKEEHGGGKALRARTVDAIAAAGYVVDMEFWPELDIADCSQCHANCHNSPKHA
ncbi:glycine-rich domain-containing protein [Streptomyces malaysiensis]|uniref:glycine-rich domain-containing protein n=1 Tax=Streptomyces malaysiensis TaxID=92644 RepID=UPI00367F6A28